MLPRERALRYQDRWSEPSQRRRIVVSLGDTTRATQSQHSCTKRCQRRKVVLCAIYDNFVHLPADHQLPPL